MESESTAGNHSSGRGRADVAPTNAQSPVGDEPTSAARVAFVTTYDPTNVHAHGGWAHFMASALARAGLQIDHVGPLSDGYGLAAKAKVRFHRHLLGCRYRPDKGPALARRHAEEIDRHVSQTDAAVVLTTETAPVAHLECDRPIILWADATFGDLVDFYPRYSGLCQRTRRDGDALERAALHRCALAIYSSRWAARTAMSVYGLPPERVAVVPWGASLASAPSRERVAAVVDKRLRQRDKCRLLFLGRDWERKGGPFAVQVVERLNHIGLSATLAVVGCVPYNARRLPQSVDVRGYVGKDTEHGRRVIAEELAMAHFLLLPTTADCTPLAVPEAAAYGLPSISRAVGGVGEVVSDATGRAFDANASADDYARYIADIFSDPARYRRRAESSRQAFESRLNWDLSAHAVRRLLEAVVS